METRIEFFPLLFEINWLCYMYMKPRYSTWDIVGMAEWFSNKGGKSSKWREK